MYENLTIICANNHLCMVFLTEIIWHNRLYQLGDEIVDISVYIPDTLTKDERKAIETLAGSDNISPSKKHQGQNLQTPLRILQEINTCLYDTKSNPRIPRGLLLSFLG